MSKKKNILILSLGVVLGVCISIGGSVLAEREKSFQANPLPYKAKTGCLLATGVDGEEFFGLLARISFFQPSSLFSHLPLRKSEGSDLKFYIKGERLWKK